MNLIKVNINTLEATRGPVPKHIRKLKAETLQNLQTELDPIPVGLIDLEWWPSVDVVPAFNPLTEVVDGEVLTADPDVKTVLVAKIVRPMTVEESVGVLAGRLADLSQLRHGKEVAGILIGEDAVDTDTLAQQRVAAVWIAMQIDPNREIDFKGKDGKFKKLKKGDIDVISSAIVNHVQACFTREAELIAALGADITTDITVGWPE
jgi:hypothetical protein